MTLSISDLLDRVLEEEGWPTFTVDPADHGGPTKGGVTLRDLERHRGRACSVAELQALEEPEARAIFTKQYITDWNFERIEDDWVRAFVVDTGILQGQPEAAMMLQRVLGVDQDASIGPVTLAAAEACDAHLLRRALLRERMHLLLDDMVYEIPSTTVRSSNLHWRHGWWNRVADFLADLGG